MTMRRIAAWTIGFALASITSAAAEDLVVTRYDDPVPGACRPGDCSLREAVVAANSDTDLDRIFLSAGTYQLDNLGAGENAGDLDVTEDLEIIGVAAPLSRIDAAGIGESAIQVGSPTGVAFTLRNVTVRNSDSNGLILGIGIHLVEDCEFRDNGTSNSESGILTQVGSDLTVRRSTSAANSGSGISVIQGAALLENVTLSGNGARELSLAGSTVTCRHCTIFDTDAALSELVVSSDSTITLANSIARGECDILSGGIVNSAGGNIESTGDTCALDPGTDQIGVPTLLLLLGDLADNGGPTRTHLPLPGSAALGGAVDGLLPDDQRGVTRHTASETGSVERTTGSVPSLIFIDGFLQGSTGAWSSTVP